MHYLLGISNGTPHRFHCLDGGAGAGLKDGLHCIHRVVVVVVVAVVVVANVQLPDNTKHPTTVKQR